MPYRAPQLSHAPTERPRRWVGAAIATVSVAAIVGGSVLVVRSAEPAVTQVRRPDPPAWPSQAHAWEVHRGEGNTRQVLFGLLRFTIGPRGISVATTHFDDTLIAAVPVTRGWVFVSADGTVASSETFLGAPRPVGRITGAFSVARVSVGRAVILGEDGSLWTTDGDGNGLVRHRLPADVRDATFVDATHGVAVLRDGRAMITDTAGQRWEQFHRGIDVVWAVSPGTGGVFLEGTNGPWTYRHGSTVGEVVRRPDRTQLSRAEEDQLRPFINRRYERFEGAGPMVRVRRPGGTPEPAPREEPRRYTCRSESQVVPLTALPMLRRRNVDARDIVMGTDAGPVRAMFWRTRSSASPALQTLVRVSWRGADAQGPFSATTSPSGAGLAMQTVVDARGGPLTVSAFTRRGALVLMREGGPPVLAWGTPGRPFVRVHDAFVEQYAVPPRSLFQTSPDGGVTVTWSRPLHDSAAETWSRGYIGREQQVGVVMVIDPTGVVRARRGFMSDDVSLQMIARVDGSVGPVVHDTGEPSRWRFIPVDGGDPKGLPPMRWSDIAACDGPSAGGATMTVAYPPIGLVGWTSPGEMGAVSRAELELTTDGRVCTRAVSVAGHRLTATAGDGFEGAMRCRAAARE